MKENKKLVALATEYNRNAKELLSCDSIEKCEVLESVCAFLIDELINIGFDAGYLESHQFIEL